jgi:hypothetical protein
MDVAFNSLLLLATPRMARCAEIARRRVALHMWLKTSCAGRVEFEFKWNETATAAWGISAAVKAMCRDAR